MSVREQSRPDRQAPDGRRDRPARQTPWWRLVAEREVTTRVREKGFLIGLGITVAFVVGFFVVGSFSGGPPEYDVAVVGEQDAALVAQVEDTLTALGSEEATVTATEVSDAAAAEAAVSDGDADAALLATADGYELVGDDELDPGLSAAVAQTVSELRLQANAEEQGVDLEALNAGTQVDQRFLDPVADDSGTRSTIAFAFTLVFLFTALGYGMTIAQSVVQEKESRVVEILAAAIPIRSLLWGKILGNTALALGQLVVVVAVGIVGMLVTGPRGGAQRRGLGGRVVRRVLRAGVPGAGRPVGRRRVVVHPSGGPAVDDPADADAAVHPLLRRGVRQRRRSTS